MLTDLKSELYNIGCADRLDGSRVTAVIRMNFNAKRLCLLFEVFNETAITLMRPIIIYIEIYIYVYTFEYTFEI